MQQLKLAQYSNINELHLFLGNIFAQVVYGDIPSITFHNCSSADFEISFQNRAWIIREKQKIDILPVFFFKNARLIIVIPHSAQIKKATIELSDGYVQGDEFYAQNIQLSVRSGSVRIDKCSVSNAAIMCESGNIQLRGTIKEKALILCNMGNVNLKCLSDDAYNYAVKVEIGNVHIANESFTSTTQKKGVETSPFFDISCNMGSVSIEKK